MTDPNSPTNTFLNALNAALDEVVSGGLHLRLVLKGGEIVEGVPVSVSSDASNRSPRGHLPQDQRQLYAERIEVTVQVGGKDVLLEEVETFTVAVPMPQAPPPS